MTTFSLSIQWYFCNFGNPSQVAILMTTKLFHLRPYSVPKDIKLALATSFEKTGLQTEVVRSVENVN